jgi:serine/threonine-protein kinase HipA
VGPLDPGGWTPVVGEAALEHILDRLLQDPPSADDVSASLPGKRPKLPVALDADRRICLPRGGTPSTHVLKPGSEHLFGGVQNEALCLVLARRCGLAAAPVTTGRAGSGTYLLTERYDRVAKSGRWHRLHQESFAQALGVSPERGSEQEESRAAVPTLADLLALARRVMCAPDVLALVDQFIFNALVGNPDTGADSFALMICASGITLAPMHGVACVAAWDGISPLLGGMIAGAHVGASEWEAFAAECGLNAGRLLARMETLAGAVLSQARDAAAEVAAMPAGPHLLLARFVEAIETRARHHRAVAERYCGPDRRKAGADRRGSPPLLTVVSSNG